MNQKMWLPLLTGLLVLLLAYTAISKAIAFEQFSDQMRNQPLPIWLTSLLTYLIPAVEIALVILLIIPALRIYGFFFSFVLMFVFSLYVGTVLGHAYNYVPCSCAGIFTSMSWKVHLIVNLLFTGLSFIGFSAERIRINGL